MNAESAEKRPRASGPRVVDFSTHFSGPVCSRHMVAMGADVIKVEHPVHGDGNRQFPPFFEGDGIHSLCLNPGTRSLAVQAGSVLWKQIVPALARWADVVIVGNRPTAAAKLGIDFASLQSMNPQLVYCLVSGYGIEGEWAGLPAHGLNMDALAGTLSLDWSSGVPEIPASYRSAGTTLAGMHAAIGIYAALDRRRREGTGQVVHVSIWEAAMSWMWRDLATHANTGLAWPAYQQLGSRYAVYAAKDGKALLVCPIERRFWERFCDVLSLGDELRSRGDWSGGVDLGSVWAAQGERELIQACLRTRDAAEWLGLLAAADIPVAPVLDWRDTMLCAHAQANGVMASYEQEGHTVKVPTIPVSVHAAGEVAAGTAALAAAHRAKANKVSRPPALGEDNAEILRELGIAPTSSPAPEPE